MYFIWLFVASYPVLSCWTQSKLPCGLSRATFVTPKLNILSSSLFSEQGIVILCDMKARETQTRETITLNVFEIFMHEMRWLRFSICRPVLLTPWLPLKQMVGCEDKPWRKKTKHLIWVCLGVTHKQASTRTRTRTHTHTHTHTRTHMCKKKTKPIQYRGCSAVCTVCTGAVSSFIVVLLRILVNPFPVCRLLCFMSVHSDQYDSGCQPFFVPPQPTAWVPHHASGVFHIGLRFVRWTRFIEAACLLVTVSASNAPIPLSLFSPHLKLSAYTSTNPIPAISISQNLNLYTSLRKLIGIISM